MVNSCHKNKINRLKLSPQVRHFVPYFACGTLGLLLLFTILPLARRNDSATATIDPQNYSLTLSTPQSTNLSINPSASGAVGIAENSINVTANSPSGYTLYISTDESMTDNKIYLTDATTKDSTNTINATTGTFASPAALDTNSWGYAVAGATGFDAAYSTTTPDADAKFAAMPLYADVDHDATQAIKYKTTSATTPETTTVYLGTKANTTLTPGIYTTTLSYLVIGHLVDSASTAGEIEIANDETTIPGDYSNKTIHLITSLSTNLYLGDVSVNLTKGSSTSSCTNIAITTQNPLTLSCQLPNGLEVGSYDVTIETGIWTHTEEDLFTIKNFFTVHYDGNKPSDATTDVVDIPSDGGESSDDPSVTNVAVDIEGLPALAGYDFLGYDEDSTATTPYYEFDSDDISFDPATITVSANTPKTLYAIWQKQVMTFDKAFVAAGKTKYNGTNYYAMQDMSTSICNAVATGISNDGSDTQVTQLIDTRDNKLYWVAKLKTTSDGSTGECWMTQNLDLDIITSGANAITLDSTNSDIVGTWASGGNSKGSAYPPTDTKDEFSGGSDNYAYTYSWDLGDYYWNGTWLSAINNAAGFSAFSNGFSTTSPSVYGEHYKVGNHYQWLTAVAGTGYKDGTKILNQDAEDSICPAGWRLPTSNSDPTTTPYSFGRLTEAYGITSNTTGVNKLTGAPLYLVPTGYVQSDSLHYAAYYGRYWSSMAYSGGDAYYFYFTSSIVNPSASSYRYDGYAIRCVSK